MIKMLTYKSAKPEQYDKFLQLLQAQASDYLEHTLELMEMGWEEFGHLFKTVGQVFGIYEDGHLAGFYWMEERGQELHLHGLILKEQFQNRRIGTQTLKRLEVEYWGKMAFIELGVHQSNEKARALYRRLGYRTVKVLNDLVFHIMQRQLV